MSWGTFVHNPNIVRSPPCAALENRLAALSSSGDLFAWYRYQGNTDGTAFDPLYTTDRSGNGNDLSLYGALPVTFTELDGGEPCGCPAPNTVAQSGAGKAFNYRVVSVGDTLYDGDPLTVGGIVQSTGQGSALGSAEVPVIGFTRFRNPSNGCYIYFEPDTQDLYLYYTRDDTGAIVRELSTVTWPGYNVWMYLEFALDEAAGSVKFTLSYLDLDGVTEVNQTQTFSLLGGGLDLWPYSSGVSTQIWNYNGLNTGLDVGWMYKWILKGNSTASVGSDKFFALMNACEPVACYPYSCTSLSQQVSKYSADSLLMLDTVHATTAGVETEITFPVDVGTETLKLAAGASPSTTTLTSEGQAIDPCDPADPKYSMTVTNVAATSFPQLVLDNRSTKNGVNFAYGIKNARGLTEVITTGAAYPLCSRDIRITSSRGVLDVFFEIQASNTVDNVSSTYDAGIRLGFNSFSELEGTTFSSVSEAIGSFDDLGLLSSGGIFPDYAVMGVNFSYSTPSVVSGGGFYKFQIDIVAELILWENYESQLPGTGSGRVRTITLNKTVYAGGYSLGGGIPTGVSIASMTDTRLFDDSTLALPFLVTKDSDFVAAEIQALGTAFARNQSDYTQPDTC